MKKIFLLGAPLLALSLCTNCSNTTKTYTVTWLNHDGTVLEIDKDVPEGTIPHYDSDEPTKKEVRQYAYIFTGWDGDITKKITGDTTFTAQFEQKIKYTVSVDDQTTENIVFSGLNDEELIDVYAVEGVDLSFKMTVNEDESSNDPEYILPTQLHIESGGVELVDGYKIDPIDTEGKIAKVTIDGSKIIGAITVSGKAVKSGEYTVTMPYHFGLKAVEDYTRAFGQGGEDYTTITLEPATEFDLPPLSSNIYVRFDNCSEEAEEKIQWVSPSEGYTDYCEYQLDQQTKKVTLTIKEEHIKSNIIVIARTTAPILDGLSWEEIDNVSISGVAGYVFYYGEEKTITIDSNVYTAKIIGFNHNNLKGSGKKAGITFEFNELISDNDGNAIKQAWDNTGGSETKNTNFPNSSLNTYLNSTLLNKLDFKKYIKQVDVKVSNHNRSGATMTYSPYLFPLAYSEYSATFDADAPTNEGSIYEYYKMYPETRQKSDLNGKMSPCWMRSPVLGSQYSVWRLSNDLDDPFGQGTAGNSKYYSGVSPAFCI